jgi:hypothetical protein
MGKDCVSEREPQQMLHRRSQPDDTRAIVDWSWMKRLVRCVRDGDARIGMLGKPKAARIGVASWSEAADVTGWAAIMSAGRRGDFRLTENQSRV